MGTYLLWLASALGDPLLSDRPVDVELEQACLAAPLDELVGLGNELCVKDPRRQVRVGRKTLGRRVISDLSNLWGGGHEVLRDNDLVVEDGDLGEPVVDDQLGVVLADRWEDEVAHGQTGCGGARMSCAPLDDMGSE